MLHHLLSRSSDHPFSQFQFSDETDLNVVAAGVVSPAARQAPAVATAHVLADMIDAVVATTPGEGGALAQMAALHDDMVDWEAVRTAPMEYVRPETACLSGPAHAQSLGDANFSVQTELSGDDRRTATHRWRRPFNAVECICCWRHASRYTCWLSY